MRNIEHNIQISLVKYLDWNNYTFFAIPNGGLRNLRVAQKLKAEGVKAGAADLFICLSNGKYHGLFIEVKSPGNYQQKSQKIFEQKVTELGYKYSVVRSIDDLISVLKEYESVKPVNHYQLGFNDGMINANMTKI